MTASDRPRRSLRARWTLVLLVCGGLPLVALSIATERIQREGLNVAERSLQLAVIEQADVAVDRLLDQAAEASHRVGVLLKERSITDVDVRVRLAQDAVREAAALASISIFDAQGVFQDSITRTTQPLREQSRLTVNCETDGVGRWLSPEHTAEGTVLTYREALMDHGACVAWFVTRLTPGSLERAVGDISAVAFTRRDRVVVLDEHRRVLAADGAEPSALGAARLPPDGALRQSVAMTSEYLASDGTPMVATWRASPNRGWATWVTRPQAEAYEALGRARRTLFIATFAFLVLALGFGTVMAARTTKPIADLVALTRHYGRREFSRRADIQSGDELQLLGDSLGDMATQLASSEVEITRRALVQSNLSRYLPLEVANAIAEGRADLALGGQRCEISVLFADVVAFTSFAEGQKPEQVVTFLNELFTVLSEVVFRHGGVVDKFVGDSVMALFGAPTVATDHARRAIAAAEDMHRFVEVTSTTWRERYGFSVKLAIGVNAGESVVGNLGSERRMEYTAIGDTVNVASRLEALARPGQTLTTRAVVESVGDEFQFASLGAHPLRGKAHAVEVYELK